MASQFKPICYSKNNTCHPSITIHIDVLFLKKDLHSSLTHKLQNHK